MIIGDKLRIKMTLEKIDLPKEHITEHHINNAIYRTIKWIHKHKEYPLMGTIEKRDLRKTFAAIIGCEMKMNMSLTDDPIQFLINDIPISVDIESYKTKSDYEISWIEADKFVETIKPIVEKKRANIATSFEPLKQWSINYISNNSKSTIPSFIRELGKHVKGY
jgi:hypothetical protein